MDQRDKNPNRLRVNPKWSELCPDLLRCVFKQLSFTNLNRAKSVCRSWNSASKGCVPKRNQIPWVILFPRKKKSKSNSCFLAIPDDEDEIYETKTRDLGVDFAQSRCLATYGSWLLMFNHLCNLYILNPLTLERIDLPLSLSKFTIISKYMHNIACLWINEETKDYLVVWSIDAKMVFTRKGDDTWRDISPSYRVCYLQIVYNNKDHKVYTYKNDSPGPGSLHVWDFSSDIPRKDADLPTLIYQRSDPHNCKSAPWIQISTTVPGQLMFVDLLTDYKTWQFRIFEFNPLTQGWVQIDSLGDEAIFLDFGFTVVAKDIPGIKKNSIYFSGVHHPLGDLTLKDPDYIYVYDLTTQTLQPHYVFSSRLYSDAQWFFPDFTG